MRIQHNIMAMNAYRNYNTNTSALSKNLEKLSSGYKINRAGDDAAGLAISEKMRAQITGLETAQKNAKDGISLVQTAEGALTEVHDMLNRMTELATQSANGTFDDSTDRAQLQKEVEALKTEINRIADSANFNGIQLLDGSLSAGGAATSDISLTYGDVSGITAKVSRVEASFKVNLDGIAVKNTNTTKANLSITVKIGDKTVTLVASSVAAGANATAGNFKLAAGTYTIGGVEYTLAATAVANGIVFNAKTTTDYEASGISANPAFEITVTGKTGEIVADRFNDGSQVIAVGRNEKAAQVGKIEFDITANMIKEGASFKIGDKVVALDFESEYKKGSGKIGIKDLLDENGKFDPSPENLQTIASRLTQEIGTPNNGELSVGFDKNKIIITTKSTLTTKTAEKYDTVQELKDLVSVSVAGGGGSELTLQIGDTSDSFNQLKVSIEDIHTKSLGIDEIDIGSQDGAKEAVSIIKDAINKVSDVRGTLGATQNRLDHTINNLSVMTENIQDAESTIRDTDVADEMMAYTKNNILIQSAQAMLAQANQVPQGVLQLLQ